MKWTDKLGNQYRLCWRPWPVRVLAFDDPWWVDDGIAEGVVVKMTTCHGDEWYVRPEELLIPRNPGATVEQPK